MCSFPSFHLLKYKLCFLLGMSVFMAACGGADLEDAPAPSAAGVTLQEEQTPFLNASTEVAFTGDDACFTCHEDQYRGYQEHGMARSYYPLTPDRRVETFPSSVIYHEASGFYYRAFEQGGRFYQEEYRLSASGERTHRLLREMQYVVGSGTAARTYLTESKGRLYELPLTWYTQQEKWDFSPGYRQQNARFSRLIPDRCMSCHNSYPEPVPFAEGKYAQVPHGIGCERCHGPGALHVEERLASPEVPGEVDHTIVNPKHLSLERRLDVCQQCHLHTAVSLLREGRTAYDFRPSQALASHLALFSAEAPAATDQISVISHADRMKQSACFIQTRAQGREMDCMTCHNPHEGFRTQGPAYFNDTCVTCHALPRLQQTLEGEAQHFHTATANCIACHMPRVEAEDAPHASFTDHRIRVVQDVPAPPATSAPESVTLIPYFEEDRRAEDAPVYEGMAYIVYGRQGGDEEAVKKGITLLSRALEAQPQHGEGQYLLGFARLQEGQVQEAIPALEEAVRLNPGLPERLNTLAQAYEAAGIDPLQIARLYRRALSIQPALADVRVNYGRLLEAQGRLEEAAAQYRQAAEEQPWLAAAHYNLGTVYLRQGALEEAEASLQRAVELEPAHAEALGNLGLLYASRGQMEAARAQFEQAVAAAPASAVALGNLGTYHLNQDSLATAISLLERAVQADPRYADGLANLALAHFRRDDLTRARTYAQRALDVDPSHTLARQILAAL